MTGAALEARGVDAFLKGRQVLSGVTVEFARGTLSVVVGPNGAGKSTLLKCCAGLIETEAGTVLAGGEPLAAMPPPARARRIAYLPQTRFVHWPLAVRDVVALGRLPHGSGRALADRDAVEGAMETMALGRLAGRAVGELSGGELARVLLARALAQETPIVIADEPVAGLDPAHQLELFSAFLELTRAGRTIVVAMHELSLAARFADHAVLLSEGSVLAAGPAREALTRDRIAAAFGVDAFVGKLEGVPVVLPVSAR